MSYQNFPFPIQPEYTAIALAYTNRAYIADEVSPRVPVGKREFKWNQYNRDEMFTVPDTTVGRKGVPNVVQFGSTEVAGFVKDYGLDDLVPNDDLENAPPGENPAGRAVEGIAELVGKGRDLDAEMPKPKTALSETGLDNEMPEGSHFDLVLN